MFLTVHATSGVALGTLTGNPLLAFVLGFISHLFLDMVPHGDEQIDRILPDHFSPNKKLTIFALVDFAVTLIVFVVLLKNIILLSPMVLLAGALGAIMPDLLMGVTLTLNPWVLKPITWIHRKAHTLLKNPVPFLYGISIQGVFLGGLLFQLLN